jgi:tetratricopeptide (TPR) repeat protein
MRILLLASLGCAWLAASPLPASAHEPSPRTGQLTGELGEISFPNSGTAAAQADFLRGVLLLHSFEFDAARTAFRAAQAADPGFALAYWGEALTHNQAIWGEQDLPAARGALAKLAPTPTARLARAPTGRERDYLASVEALYGEGEKTARDAAYSAALGDMARKYPDDLDARSFYALSLLGLTGYTRDHANYMHAAAEAEAVYERNRRHPGALHYLIHAYDDPVHAPLGLRAARLYGKVAPAASHAQHMPSHIFFALGLWDDAIEANVAATKVARDQGGGGYHPLAWLEYAYLQQGRAEPAAQLVDLVEQDVARNGKRESRANLAYVRAIWLAEAPDADRSRPTALDPVDDSGLASLAPFAVHDFTAGLAHARAKREPDALGALQRLRARIERARGAAHGATASRYDRVGPEEIQQAEIMANALEGAIRFHTGERAAGIEQLRAAIASANNLAFEYGPPWSIKPLDELLGELLLTDGQRAEAEAAFDRTLAVHPGRRLSLAGREAALRTT